MLRFLEGGGGLQTSYWLNDIHILVLSISFLIGWLLPLTPWFLRHWYIHITLICLHTWTHWQSGYSLGWWVYNSTKQAESLVWHQKLCKTHSKLCITWTKQFKSKKKTTQNICSRKRQSKIVSPFTCPTLFWLWSLLSFHTTLELKSFTFFL